MLGACCLLMAATVAWFGRNISSTGAYHTVNVVTDDDANYLTQRRWVWAKQLCVLLATISFLIALLPSAFKEVKAIEALPEISFGVSLLTSLVFDDRLKGNRFTSYSWVPCYFANTLYLLTQLFSVMSADGQMHDCYIFAAIAAVFFMILATIFSIFTINLNRLKQDNAPTREFTSGFLEYITFSYMNELIRVAGEKESLEVEDVPTIIDDDTCEKIDEKIREGLKRHGSLTYALFAVVSSEFIESGIFQLFCCLLAYCAPFSLECILTHVTSSEASSRSKEINFFLSINPLFAVTLLFAGPFVQSILLGQNYTKGRRVAVRVRAGLIATLYAKGLRADLTTLSEGVGTLNNLISVDVKQVEDFVCYFHFTWSCVMDLIICCVLLTVVIGWSALGGVTLMFLLLPLGGYISSQLDYFQTEMLKFKDERMGVMDEVLGGIRILKVRKLANPYSHPTPASMMRVTEYLESYQQVQF